MIFNQPQFLWGLFAVAIPIVIHLVNFRRSRTLESTIPAAFSAVSITLKDFVSVATNGSWAISFLWNKSFSFIGFAPI